MTKRHNHSKRQNETPEVNLELVMRLLTTTNERSAEPSVIGHEPLDLNSSSVMPVLRAAQTLTFPMLVENRLDESGRLVLDVSIYRDEVSLDENKVERWARPNERKSIERDITDDLEDLFDDPRLGRYAARAAW